MDFTTPKTVGKTKFKITKKYSDRSIKVQLPARRAGGHEGSEGSYASNSVVRCPKNL